MKSHKNITRLDFLKISSLTAAGFSFLPHSVLAMAKNSEQSYAVNINKLAAYQIIIPDQANSVEQQAAEKLQHYLAELLRKNLVLRKEGDYESGPAFLIGGTQYAKTRRVDFKLLKEDGFAYHPAGENLVIAGGAGKGVLYGTYGLLELWGFRMYTPTSFHTPDAGSVSIPKSEVVVVPGVDYRTTSYRATRDPEYTDWHRLSSRNDWGLFVHTFNELVPPDKYGKTHSEYFSLINGNRLPGTQLCLSNSEVLAVLIANLKERWLRSPTPPIGRSVRMTMISTVVANLVLNSTRSMAGYQVDLSCIS